MDLAARQAQTAQARLDPLHHRDRPADVDVAVAHIRHESLEAGRVERIGSVWPARADEVVDGRAAKTGDRAMQWLEAKAGKGATKQLRWIERKFARYGYPLVAIMPNNAICLFAGSSGMRPRTFWTLNVLGTIGRLVFFWYLGKALHEPLTRFLDWVQRYQWPLLALSVGIVMLQAFRSQSRGEIEPISAIEDEIEALTIEAAEPPADAAKPTEAGTTADDDNRVADDENNDVR